MWNKIKSILSACGNILLRIVKSKATVKLATATAAKALVKKRPDIEKYLVKIADVLNEVSFEDSELTPTSVYNLIENHIHDLPDDYKAGILSLIESALGILGEEMGDNKKVIESLVSGIREALNEVSKKS